MSYASEVLADSPRVYWRLGETSGTTAYDVSGGRRNGTYSGSPALGATGLLTGDIDKAVTFDGVNDRVSVTDNVTLTAWTVEAWIKSSTVPTGGQGVIAAKDASGSRVFNLSLGGGSGYPDLQAFTGSSGTGEVYTTVNVCDGKVHHLVGTYDGSVLILYLDGVRVSSMNLSGTPRTATPDFSAGASGDGLSFFGGVIDEVAYYQTALSAARVTAHYWAGLASLYAAEVTKDAPRLFWRLGETSGTTAYDASGNARNGTYAGSPTLGAAGLLTGDTNKAVTFDGVDDLVSVADSVGLTAFTIEAWVTIASPITGMIASRWEASPNRLFILELVSGKVRLNVRDASNAEPFFQAATALSTGVPHHVAATFSSGTARIYVDGAEVATMATTLGSSSTPAFAAGARSDATAGSFFAGVIDEVAYYTTALAPARIATHYFAGVASKYALEVVRDAPRGYWRLGESSGTVARDASANGHDGTYAGSNYTLASTGLLTGDADKGVTFTNGRVEVPETVDLTAFTIEMWVKGVQNGTYLITRRLAASIYGGIRFWVNGNAAQISITKDAATFSDVSSGFSIADGARHHLVATYDGTTLRLYVDGVQVGTPSTLVSGTLDTTDNPFVIGGYQDSGGTISSGSSGTFDEVSLYTTALSPSRVAVHYFAGIASQYAAQVAADAPRTYWRLGETSGTTAYDASGNGRNGTYSGSPTLGTVGLLTGDADKAVTFDGVDDKVQVADNAVLTAYTVEALIKKSGTPTMDSFIIARDNDTTGQRLFSLHVTSTGLGQVITWSAGGGFQSVSTASSICDGVAHHLAATWDGAVVTLYLDGAIVGTVSWSNAMSSSAVPLSVGQPGISEFYFAGVIDEPAYYSTALNPTRVAAHYAATMTATIVPLGQASTTMSAQPLIPVEGPLVVPLGQASTATTAQILTPALGARTVALGQASSTATAQGLTFVGGGLLGQAATTETAQALAPSYGPLVVPLDRAEVTSAAQAFLVPPVALGRASESETALPLTPIAKLILPLGQAVESGGARPMLLFTQAPTPGGSGGGGSGGAGAANGVVRWVFVDPDAQETWVVPVNPNKMGSPYAPRNLALAHGSKAGPRRIRAIDRAPSSPASWTFSGYYYTKSHHDQLTAWASRNSIVWITDHLHRSYEVVIETFNPTDRKARAGVPWRGQFEMTCLVLREIK